MVLLPLRVFSLQVSSRIYGFFFSHDSELSEDEKDLSEDMQKYPVILS